MMQQASQATKCWIGKRESKQIPCRTKKPGSDLVVAWNQRKTNERLEGICICKYSKILGKVFFLKYTNYRLTGGLAWGEHVQVWECCQPFWMRIPTKLLQLSPFFPTKKGLIPTFPPSNKERDFQTNLQQKQIYSDGICSLHAFKISFSLHSKIFKQ